MDSVWQRNVAILKSIGSGEHTFMTILAVLVGITGGFGAVGFRFLIDFFQSVFYGSARPLLDLVQWTPWYVILLVPAALVQQTPAGARWAALAGVAGAILVIVRGAHWPGWSGRYSRGSDAGADDTLTPRAMWEALDRGQDPTRDDNVP